MLSVLLQRNGRLSKKLRGLSLRKNLWQSLGNPEAATRRTPTWETSVFA
jgi:hypothetical protein